MDEKLEEKIQIREESQLDNADYLKNEVRNVLGELKSMSQPYIKATELKMMIMELYLDSTAKLIALHENLAQIYAFKDPEYSKQALDIAGHLLDTFKHYLAVEKEFNTTFASSLYGIYKGLKEVEIDNMPDKKNIC